MDMTLTNSGDIGIQLLGRVLARFDRHSEVQSGLNCGPLSCLDTPGIETNVLAEFRISL